MNLHRKPTNATANALPASRKKWIESQYVEEARRASSLFPPGELAPEEPPDFLLVAGRITVGIEVTLLCREEQRAEGVRLSRVADKARRLYSGLADSEPIDVTAVFSPDTESVGSHQLTKGLANFSHDNWRGQGCSFDWNECELPAGYRHLTIQPAREVIRPWWGVNCV